MKGVTLLLALALAGACAAPTATEPVADPGAGPSRDEYSQPTCRGGYAIANRNGELVCEPIGDEPTSTPSSDSTVTAEPTP